MLSGKVKGPKFVFTLTISENAFESMCNFLGKALRALVTNPIAKDYFSRPRLEISEDEAHQDGYLR